MNNEKRMHPDISFADEKGTTACATPEEQREEATARLKTLVGEVGMAQRC